jgi:hypothetical protein
MIYNDKLHGDFPQSPEANFSFRVNLRRFFEYIKQTYPQETDNVEKLTAEFQTEFADLLDNIAENLTKAKALTVTATLFEEFANLDAPLVNDYLWALEDLVTNAYNLAAVL